MSEGIKYSELLLTKTNATLEFFVDFEKVKRNVKQVEIDLNQLNYLIGKSDLLAAIKELYRINPGCFNTLKILLALRVHKIYNVIHDDEVVEMDHFFESPERILYFLEKTGLAEIFYDRTIKNLVDYVFGVEVGLDTHARKNRSGDAMVKLVSDRFNEHGIKFRQEVNSSEYSNLIGFDEKNIKRFDFVIETEKMTYLIETNFYNGGGSKPTEVFRAYSKVAEDIRKTEGYKFVWITDGAGWASGKSMYRLNDLANSEYIFTLKSLDKFIAEVKESKKDYSPFTYQTTGDMAN